MTLLNFFNPSKISLIIGLISISSGLIHANQEWFDSAANGNIETIERLIQEGADLDLTNDSGLTALMLAAQNGHAEMLNVLIKGGANLNLKQNLTGDTALIFAIIKEDINSIRALLKANANPNIPGRYGLTPLINAAINNSIRAVEALIKAGVNLNQTDPAPYKRTALMYAARQKHEPIVQILLVAGANLPTVEGPLAPSDQSAMDLISKKNALYQKYLEKIKKTKGILNEKNDPDQIPEVIQDLILEMTFKQDDLNNARSSQLPGEASSEVEDDEDDEDDEEEIELD